MSMHQVIVGNIGTVYNGDNEQTAKYTYQCYVAQSALNTGRASGEDVTLITDDEIEREYLGKESPDLFNCDVGAIVRLDATVQGSDIIWRYPTFTTETHCPADRLGGPIGVSHIVRESWGRRLFVMAVVDSYSPVYHFVFGDCFGDAYSWFIEDRTEELKVSPDDTADYPEDERSYTDSGVHVDTDNVQGFEVKATATILETSDDVSNIHAVIVEHFAKVLFACAWADNEEEHERTYPGCDIFEVMPNTIPQSALDKAKEAIRNIEIRNAKWNLAVHFVSTVIPDLDPEEKALQDFGHYLAMESLGHGVAWEDYYTHNPHGLDRIDMIEFSAHDMPELDLRYRRNDLMAPSVKKLTEAFGEEKALQIRALIIGEKDPDEYESVQTYLRPCFNRPRDAELIMLAINEVLECFGTEVIRDSRTWLDSYYMDIVAEYVNMGDPYLDTILLDHRSGNYRITSWGQYVESNRIRD